MHHVFIFQLRYTDIFLSKLVGLYNYFETRCKKEVLSLFEHCEWIKPPESLSESYKAKYFNKCDW